MAQKMVGQTTIKSKGNVFYELFRFKPHHISNLSGEHIQGCALEDGDWGSVGSTIVWNYTHDGKKKVGKNIIEAIDEEKKLVKFKVIGGDLLELYKTMSFTCRRRQPFGHMDFRLREAQLNDDVPEPHTLMDFVLALTKNIEIHG